MVHVFGKRISIVALALSAVALASTATVAQAATPAPTITNLSVHSGAAAGGTALTITGKNFVKVTAVKFGTVKAPGFKVLSKTKIQVGVPAHAVGVVDVRVLTKAKTSKAVKAGKYTFTAPLKTTTSVAVVVTPASVSFPVTIAASTPLSDYPLKSVTVSLSLAGVSLGSWQLLTCPSGCVPTLAFDVKQRASVGDVPLGDYDLNLVMTSGQIWLGSPAFTVPFGYLGQFTATASFAGAPGFAGSSS